MVCSNNLDYPPSLLLAQRSLIVALCTAVSAIQYYFIAMNFQISLAHAKVATKFLDAVEIPVHHPNGYYYFLGIDYVSKPQLDFLRSSEGEKFIITEIIKSNLTFLGTRSYHFPGGALITVYIISGSLVGICTFPAYSFVSFNVYTYGNYSVAENLVDTLRLLLIMPDKANVAHVARGSKSQLPLEIENLIDIAQIDHPRRESRPILFGTHRPLMSTLPVKVDICVNEVVAGGECMMWRNASLLYSLRSKTQLVEVVDRQFGIRCLVLDSVAQFCNTPDNDMYNRGLSEYVMQPLLDRIADVDVVIVGGGDGWVATHLIDVYDPLIKSIRVIDNDPIVSSVTKEYFPVSSGADSFNDSRVHYIPENAMDWLINAPSSSADAIIIDCTDQTSQYGQILYTELFYFEIRRVLRPCSRFSQQMNVVHELYQPFQHEVKDDWEKLGFIEVKEWEVSIQSYGDATIMMGAQKPTWLSPVLNGDFRVS